MNKLKFNPQRFIYLQIPSLTEYIHSRFQRLQRVMIFNHDTSYLLKIDDLDNTWNYLQIKRVLNKNKEQNEMYIKRCPNYFQNCDEEWNKLNQKKIHCTSINKIKQTIYIFLLNLIEISESIF